MYVALVCELVNYMDEVNMSLGFPVFETRLPGLPRPHKRCPPKGDLEFLVLLSLLPKYWCGSSKPLYLVLCNARVGTARQSMLSVDSTN